MQCLDRGRTDVRSPMCCASAAALVVFVGLTLVAAGPGPPLEAADHVLLTPGADAAAIRRALAGARRKLETPGCQQIVTDYADPSGQPLQGKLDAFRVTPAEYLGLVFFSDGDRVTNRGGRSPCHQPGIMAFTQPGSRVVHVCTRQFVDLQKADGGLAENLLVHEMLHSLGLGENPPSPGEITRSVRVRCGR